jgi:CRISPR/Cas system Type II protein with McrA/HNH and RuvC-like nuclease domain
MSVWTNIQGDVKIHKKDNVSIKKVITNILSDEFSLDVKTQDKIDHYHHTIDCNVCIDGYDFIKHYKEFLSELKPINGGLDLTCQLRFLL